MIRSEDHRAWGDGGHYADSLGSPTGKTGGNDDGTCENDGPYHTPHTVVKKFLKNTGQKAST